MSVTEFEELLTANNLLSAHNKDEHYESRMTRDIAKYAGRITKCIYDHNGKICAYSVIEISEDDV